MAQRTSRSRRPVAVRSSTVSRWGNSLGLRIPQEAAERLKLTSGSRVSVELHHGAIVVRPIRKKWTEADLLRGVTPDMVGGEIDSGGPVGKEVW
jgi:antitoxin MazE